MPDQTSLVKAQLRQLDSTFKNEIEPDTWCTVQFNPESLKVSFANQLVKPAGAGDQRGPAAYQFVGSGTTKLSLTLWFDVGSPQGADAPVDDVRKLTQKVAFFITPTPAKGKGKDVYLPPAVRFLWGSFKFDGLMDSLEETLEFFSPDGKPLRASLALSLSQQSIEFAFADTDGGGGAGSTGATGGTPGTTPMEEAPAGSTFQDIADGAGLGDNWQPIAAANGIENPRLLTPGTLVNLNLQAPTLGGSLGLQGALEVASPQLSANALQVGGGGALVS
jgi:Contractile injection system tube protein